MTQSPLVSTEWLAQNMWRPDVVIADASWYLPQAKRNAREEYRTGHIPGAVFFDIDAISDHRGDLAIGLQSLNDAQFVAGPDASKDGTLFDAPAQNRGLKRFDFAP